MISKPFAIFSGHNTMPKADEIIERSYDTVIGGRAWRGRRANSALSKPSVNRRRPGCRVLGRAPAPLTRSNSSITQRSSVSSDRAIACSTVSRPRSTSPASPRQAVSLPPSSTKRVETPLARWFKPAAQRPRPGDRIAASGGHQAKEALRPDNGSAMGAVFG